MGFNLVTPATDNPVSLSEAKTQIRVDSTSEDSLISGMIGAATSHCEYMTHRQYVTATWKLTVDCFPCSRCIKITKPPLQSVTSITYYDADGTQQTLSAFDYIVDTSSEPGRICLAPSSSWPSTQTNRVNAVEITFVSGYGVPDDVPQDIKSAILMTVGHLYENREATTAINLKTVPMAVDALLARHDWGGRYG